MNALTLSTLESRATAIPVGTASGGNEKSGDNYGLTKYTPLGNIPWHFRATTNSVLRGPAGQRENVPLPSDQLKERIRELCAKAISATGAELDATLAELQKALHQHAEELRKTVNKLRRD